MTKRVVYGEDEQVCQWVGERLDEDDFGPGAKGIGLEKDGELIAGVVFNNYNKLNIYMHVAAKQGTNWLTRQYLTCCFAYPFVQLGVNRVTGLVRVDNLPAQKFDEHLGFKREGLVRRACEDGTDMILYGMLREECRFLPKVLTNET
jgi:RimJ/RimL family protein N-acetyltransferase